MRIERVSPGDRACEASRVLQAAWTPPCLRYAPEDLEWLFHRPGWGPHYGLMAIDEEERPIGFVGALARRVRFRGQVREVYSSSFLSVVPERGLGSLATALVRIEGRDIRGEGRPILVFAEPGSLGEAMLKGVESVGMVRRSAGTYRVHGGLPPRSTDGLPTAREATETDLDAVVELAAQCEDGTIIRDSLNRAQLEHERADPRGRCLAVVEDNAGRTVAAAAVYRSETIGPRRPETTATIGALWMSRQAPEALRALLAFTASRWAGTVTSPVVTMPNVTGLNSEFLRASGVRVTPAVWTGWIFAADPLDPLLEAEGMDLEII